eukprot:GHRR01033653.1.p1 GENE.GHRR01033653.1~~GHRR01033653.1.p1  ORF type:complete len:152 (-),score=14.16 GHRR01033653.1:36-491(-)
MTSFSYFLSVMIRKTQAAVYLGFCVFIVGWVFQTVIFVAKLPYSPAFYYSSSNRWGRVFFWVFNLFPWDPLTKGISDFNEATLSPSDPGRDPARASVPCSSCCWCSCLPSCCRTDQLWVICRLPRECQTRCGPCCSLGMLSRTQRVALALI